MTQGSELRIEAPARGQRSLGFFVLVAGLLLMTLAAVFVGNGNPALAMLPVAGFLVLCALAKIPLRWPALVLMVAALTLENPAEVPGGGVWKSPLYPLGQLLLAQLKHTFSSAALVLTGVDVVILLLFVIYGFRRAAGSRLDIQGAVATARPLIWATYLCLVGVVLIFIYGMLRGGSPRFAVWQMQRVLYLPVVFLFLQSAFPGPSFHRALGRVVVFCACIKAALAIYLRGKFPDMEYATIHADSMLFATASCLLVILLIEQPNRGNLLRCVTILPLLVVGMIANDRRLVWVELGLALVLVFVLCRRTRFKVKLVRGLLVLLPLLPIYLAAGWSSGTGIFKPVSIVRSLVDSQSDPSTQWRDLENFNLVATLRSHPIAGTGWGHPFENAVALPDITAFYELEPYVPHNSVVGLWAYTGYIGFATLWMLLVVGIFFAARSYRLSSDPMHRTAALTSFSAIIIYMVHSYGDMGLGTWTSIFLVAPALVVVGKLAVAVGAWPGRARAPALASHDGDRSVKPANPLFPRRALGALPSTTEAD